MDKKSATAGSIFIEGKNNPEYYAVPFGPTDDFAQFISRIYESSYRDTGVVATKDDKIITLSTCGTTSGEGRFVVHAVRVDEYQHENIVEGIDLHR